uniref:Uncharacterized protein n=1 Tax=Oryza meridionalis TaxID=40149 RepID=A0A0E0E1E7_9ORYZ
MATQACAASTTSVGPAHPRVSADSCGPARLRRFRVIPHAPANSVAAPPAPPPPRGQASRSPLSRVAISGEAVSGPVWFGCMHMHLIPILKKKGRRRRRRRKGDKKDSTTQWLRKRFRGSGSASCVIAKRPTPASLREAAPPAYGQDSAGDTLRRLAPGAGPVWRVLPPARPLPPDHATVQRLAPADSTVLPLTLHSSAGHAGLKAKLHRPRAALRGTPGTRLRALRTALPPSSTAAFTARGGGLTSISRGLQTVVPPSSTMAFTARGGGLDSISQELKTAEAQDGSAFSVWSLLSVWVSDAKCKHRSTL